MKKVVLKLDVLDEKVKTKAMKNVSSLTGVESIAMDMKDKKLTVTGDIDPVTIVSKLRKICHTEIVSVGPAKEPEKKEDGGDAKKKEEEEKKKKQEEEKKKKAEEALKAAYAAAYHNHFHNNAQAYPYYNYQQQQGYNQYNPPPIPYYSKVVHDETPNCVIC